MEEAFAPRTYSDLHDTRARKDPVLIRRPFLRTTQALIDVYGKELTLRVNDEAITFNVGHTSRYSYRHDDESVNRIDVIDVTCEEYAQEVLGCSDSSKSGNPTSSLDHIITTSFPSLTPFEGGDFVLEEIEACLTNDSIPTEYASKTMTDAQAHYTTTEKELLSVVYAFKKFRPYLVLSKTIVYTDHSALKYFLAKQDAKLRLLRWILLLQEFDVIIHDKKGAENLMTEHLSRLENPHQSDLEKKEITEIFPPKTLGMVTFRGDSSTPWFADIPNYHAGNFFIKGTLSQQKKKFFKNKPLISSRLAIMDPLGDIMVRTSPLRKSLISVSIGRLFTKMPMTWSHGGIDFIGPFPSSRGNKYILVAVDYLSKWVKAKALPTNDARVVVKILKSLFA
ncbi:reverse transcriptase domain-containing protein [Tanacetum coccineum]